MYLYLHSPSSYACSFIGWVLAALTNPLLTPHLTLGQLLFVGAVFQILAQALRPWSSLPGFCLSFTLQAIGSGFQDAHCNTFVGSVDKRVAHRWLGFIHAAYALALVIGPLVATSLASHRQQGSSRLLDGDESWRRTYFAMIGANVVNLAWVIVAFRDSIWLPRWKNKDNAPSRGGDEARVTVRNTESGRHSQPQQRKEFLSSLQDMLAMLKVKDVWLISLFFFFAAGASQASNGESRSICGWCLSSESSDIHSKCLILSRF